jgi:hypothetical protein
MDDRICMHYVLERIEHIQEKKTKKELEETLEFFKREIIYNLGVNSRIRHGA